MSTVTISRPFLMAVVTISLVIFFTKAFFTLFVIFISMTAIITICAMSMTISAMSLTISAITMAISTISISVTSMTVPVTTISLVSCKTVGTDQFLDDEVGINVVAHNWPRVVVVLTSIGRSVKG